MVAPARSVASRAREGDVQARSPTRFRYLRAAHDALWQGGFTFDLEENEASIRCVAAPVRDTSGQIVAALSVASTIPYMPSERMEELIPVVQRQARAISEDSAGAFRSPPHAVKR